MLYILKMHYKLNQSTWGMKDINVFHVIWPGESYGTYLGSVSGEWDIFFHAERQTDHLLVVLLSTDAQTVLDTWRNVRLQASALCALAIGLLTCNANTSWPLPGRVPFSP